MSRFLTDLADVLRAAGLTVVELDGWESRGRSGNSPYADGRPTCIMWHHTASGGNGASDADYCTFRDPDAPIVNLVVGRDGVVHVCAAGPTNTNGKGGPLTVSRGTVPADSMNTYAIGIEISNNGVGMPYPQVQIDACFTVSVALTAAYDLEPTDVAQHVDWAPGRKIDPATAPAVEGPWQPRATNSSGSWNLADLRDECVRRSHTTPTPPPLPQPGDDDMKLYATTGPDGTVWIGNGITRRGVQSEPELDEMIYRSLHGGGPQIITACSTTGALAQTKQEIWACKMTAAQIVQLGVDVNQLD